MSGAEFAEAFWRTQNEAGGITRFLSRAGAGVIVCDAGFGHLARSIGPENAPYTLFEADTAAVMDVAALKQLAGGGHIHVFCTADYTNIAHLAAGVAAESGATSFGFAEHISPSLLCNDDPWRHAGGEPELPRLSYTIVSTARSGSTFLSDLLARNGLGNPKEHIRDAFISLARNHDRFALDFRLYLDRLRRRAAVNGCFGTKIISGFYREAEACMTAAGRTAFNELIWSAPVIYLYRRSKIEQAVSDYIARALKTWHVRDDAARAQHEAGLARLDYDFDAINQRYQIGLADELALREFVAKQPVVHHVEYEALLARTTPVVQDIVSFITQAPAPANLHLESSLMRTHSARSAAFCERFKADVIRRNLYPGLREDLVLAELK